MPEDENWIPYFGARDRLYDLQIFKIGPALRELGFKGSGKRFYLDDPEYLRLLEFETDQRRRINVEVTVTVDLLVARRDDPSIHADGFKYPSAKAHYNSSTARQVQIGTLMPDGPEKWWTVYRDEDADAVGEEMIAAIRDYGLAFLRQELS